MISAGLAFAGLIVLIVSLIMTTAFFILNSKLVDDIDRLKEKLKEYEG